MTEDELIQNSLSYDAYTGILTWKNPTSNCVQSGDVVGSPARGGALKFGINGKTFLVHRVCWFLFWGVWPKGPLDHVDRDASNNRICNLREATYQQNAQNKSCSSATGFKGVYKANSRANPFRSFIGHNEQVFYLGHFPTAVEAAAAYDQKAQELFGEFASLNFNKELSNV